MRELFEGHQTDDPVEAARRAVRPAVRHRFYKAVTIAAAEGGDGDQGGDHAIRLVGTPVRIPA